MFSKTLFVICILSTTSSVIIGKSIVNDHLNDVIQRPGHHEHAKMARYLVHKSNWTSMGTISTFSLIRGMPLVNVISIADSELAGPSTGKIYFLLTDLDFTGQDLHANNTLTVLFTEDQDLACTRNGTDPMEPTCARVIMSGKAKRLDKSSTEHADADKFFTSRHPASLHWRKSHLFYFCKLDIEHIAVLDFYGGPHFVSIDDYYKATLDFNVDSDAAAVDPIESNHISERWPSVVTPKST